MNTQSITDTSYRTPRQAARALPGLRRRVFWTLLTVVLLVSVILTYRVLTSVPARLTYPAPGQMVDVGGHQLHVQVMGEHHTGPTVILEAGLPGTSTQWAWIQPAVAQFARVVAYDRPGLGWSEQGNRPNDAAATVKQLHTALEKLEISGPYILVGHSYGGLVMRVFADRYADEVAGFVLVDSSHPDQFVDSKQGLNMYHWLPLLARLGVMSWLGLPASYSAGLPETVYPAAVAFLSDATHMAAGKAEALAWDTSVAQVRAGGDLGDLPLIVVSAEGEGLPGWHKLQADLATLSTHSEWRVAPGSEHISLVTGERHAQWVVAAIQDVWQAVTVQ